MSASAELSHALPCTLRREQLSPRLTSLTSNPQLLHSLHGLRQVIDHNTSLIGLNQTVSQTFYTRFPTCEMRGIRTEAERGEARGGLRSGGRLEPSALFPPDQGSPPLAHDTLTWDTGHTQSGTSTSNSSIYRRLGNSETNCQMTGY